MRRSCKSVFAAATLVAALTLPSAEHGALVADAFSLLPMRRAQNQGRGGTRPQLPQKSITIQKNDSRGSKRAPKQKTTPAVSALSLPSSTVVLENPTTTKQQTRRRILGRRKRLRKRSNSTAATEEFLRREFSRQSPLNVLPPPPLVVVDEESTLTSPASHKKKFVSTTTTRHVNSSRFSRITAGWVQNVLATRMDRWSNGRHQDMHVSCCLKALDLRRGILQCDASIDLQRIVFDPIRFSGGRVEATGLTLNLWSFLPRRQRQLRKSKRFPTPFEFRAQKCILTQADLIESPCIRNGLRRLLTRILNIRGMNAVFVRLDDITCNNQGKLCVEGTALTILGAQISFQVRTGLDFCSRGHVLTFPGLELSLLGELFVPVLPEVTVDLGHNCQLQHVDIKPGAVELSATVTITPEHTVRLAGYQQAAASYAAPCFVDVGRWLTQLGRFNG